MNRRLDAGQIEVLDDAVAEVLRHKTPAERVAMISACRRTVWLMLEEYLGSRHPDWDHGRLRAEVVRRLNHGTK